MTTLNPFFSLIDYRGREIKNKVTKFKYKFSEKGDDVCEFTIESDDPMLPDEPHFQEGRLLTVQWGYKGTNRVSKARRIYILDTEADYREEGLSLKITCHEKFVLAKMDKPANKNIEQLKNNTPILFSAPVLQQVNIELEGNNEILRSLLADNSIDINSEMSLGGYPIVSYYNGNQSSFRALKTYLDKLKGGPYVIDSRDDGVIIRTRDFKQPSKLTLQYRIGKSPTVLKFRPETKNRSKKSASGQTEVVAWDKKNKAAVSQVSTEADRGDIKLAGTPSLLPTNAVLVEDGKIKQKYWVAPLGTSKQGEYKAVYVKNPKSTRVTPVPRGAKPDVVRYDKIKGDMENSGIYSPAKTEGFTNRVVEKEVNIRYDKGVTLSSTTDVNKVIKAQNKIKNDNKYRWSTSKLSQVEKDYGTTTTKKKNENLKDASDKAKAIIEQTYGGPGIRKVYNSYDYGKRAGTFTTVATDNTAVAKPIHLLVSDDDMPGKSTVSPKTPKTARNQADNERKEAELNNNPATATIEGEPILESGMIVTFEGVAKRHAGNYYISELEHTFDDGGFITEITKMSRQGINKVSSTVTTKDEMLPSDKYFYNSDKPANFKWEEGSAINNTRGEEVYRAEEKVKIVSTTPDKV